MTCKLLGPGLILSFIWIMWIKTDERPIED